MNNERYNQIIDEAYEKYKIFIQTQRDLQRKEVQRLRSQGKKVKVALIELLSKEEYINKIKTDVEFAKKWGLTIYTEVEGDEVYMGIVYNGNAAKIKIK